MKNDRSFTHDWLEAEDFKGFVTFAELESAQVPKLGGVYVVLREAEGNPEFLETSPAGQFRGRDPTVSRAALKGEWVSGADVIYIGKANNLRSRLSQYTKHGRGKPIGHWGGRYIWQAVGASDY